jgi:hypothetical protein
MQIYYTYITKIGIKGEQNQTTGLIKDLQQFVEQKMKLVWETIS